MEYCLFWNKGGKNLINFVHVRVVAVLNAYS